LLTDPVICRKNASAAGKPLFGTLIALLHRGTPLLGVIDQPVLRERWLGVAGEPSTLNGAPIRSRACAEVGAAYMYSTTPHMFSGDNEVGGVGRDGWAAACCGVAGTSWWSVWGRGVERCWSRGGAEHFVAHLPGVDNQRPAAGARQAGGPR
jgi:fructose-1,6-bisphosphatase/inositol monophosphatase family enzyme